MSYDIAEEYTPYPAGRNIQDGPGSGEGFRNELLKLIERKQERGLRKIKLIMDNTFGYGSSFLDEAFGGLIRESQYSKALINETFEFITNDPVLIKQIQGYMADAEKLKQAQNNR